MVVVAAGGAFLIARQQAQGPNKAVAPPPTGLPETPDYHALVVDPGNAKNILLGTHAGVYESTTGGQSWRFAGLEGHDAMNLVRPAGRTIWTAGHEVFEKSLDGGRTWSDVWPEGLPSLDIHGFTIDSQNSSRMYAAVAGEGLFRSKDGGRSFQLVSNDVGGNVYGLAASSRRILAADPAQGVLVSDDDGASWRVVLHGSELGVAVDPDDPDRILATGQTGILLTTNGAKTWRTVHPITNGAGPVAWAPSNPHTAYVVGFDRRLYRSEDAGTSWHAVP
jgi:photosystem II stability/assembly factor-like uncharacterized protein